jgi:Rrf2 family protein
MKLINRDTDYAIRILRFMALHKDTMFTAVMLEQKLKIPYRFLRKILQIMNKKQLLRSFKGLGGGFQLSRNPESIKILEVIEAFQGKMELVECLFKKDACPERKTCPMRAKILTLEQHLVTELSSMTIATFLQDGTRGKKNFYENVI